MKHLTILLIILLSFSSCGSRKKNKASKVRIEQVAKRDMKNIILRNNTKSMEVKEVEKETHSITENNDVELIQADPNKEIILIQPNGDTTKIKGANAFISSRKQIKKEKEKKLDSISFLDKSLMELSQKVESESNIKAVDESLSVDVKRGFPWWILILIGVVYLVVSYFRKTLNPLGWVG